MIWLAVAQGVLDLVFVVFILMFRVVARDILANIDTINKRLAKQSELEAEVYALRKMVTGK